MAWLGKLIGGWAGFFFGGPLGMIAGIAFGHMFDKAGTVPKQQRGSVSSLEQRQMLFFVGAFSMLAKIAAIDGSVSSSERSRVIAFIRNDLRLGKEQEELALRIFDTAASSEESFDRLALQFGQTFRYEPNILQTMVDILVQVAAADGTVTLAEQALINRAAQIFGIAATYVDHLIARYSPKADPYEKAYSILGVDKSATDDQVKSAYRKLSREFHPDALAAKGMGEEFTAHATAKFREIQGAWETIKDARGIK
ncbi:MAG TPA: TerB family tellurite resistance protein [Sphaerochaeta sp.]|jgi:DnaJ like chaperone protein|nr:TerB family tellurite resistance protein [Sphaerochaeta sp.]